MARTLFSIESELAKVTEQASAAYKVWSELSNRKSALEQAAKVVREDDPPAEEVPFADVTKPA